MNIFLDKIMKECSKEMQMNAVRDAPLDRFRNALQIIKDASKNCLNFLSKIESDEDEIAYFKYCLPLIKSYGIEEGMIYSMSQNLPTTTAEEQIKYYKEELQVIQLAFRRSSFFYQYFKNDFHELDHCYFLRNSSPAIPLPEILVVNDGYETELSCLFAKFIAYERLVVYISNRINCLRDNVDGRQTTESHKIHGKSGLKWTGSIINLVELAYGLWLTGQLNNGNASLSQLVSWLEHTLEINVGIIQKRFAEIERRKRISRTKFLDLMKEMLINKVAESNI